MKQPVAVILAGGQARRMGGGDKALLSLAGRPMLSHVLDRIEPQVAGLCLNANGDADRFARFGVPVVADSIDGFVGPLAGVLAGLDWAADRGHEHVVRNATSCGLRLRPDPRTTPPASTSSPARRQLAPRFGAENDTTPPSIVTSSCNTTVSTPLGIIAPVRIRTACPLETTPLNGDPAADRPSQRFNAWGASPS